MGRTKGALNKSTVKKVKPIAKSRSSHVLELDENYYITCDTKQFILKQKVNTVSKDGKKIPDNNIAYCTLLKDILESAVSRMVRVPDNFQELLDKMDSIYSLIDARIPVDVKPKDLFKDMQSTEEESISD
jgi:hypothetical protein